MIFSAFRICSPPFLDLEIKFIFDSLSNLGYPRHLLHKALLLARDSFYKPKSSTFSTLNKINIPFSNVLYSSSHRNTLRSFSYPNSLCSNIVRNSKLSSDIGVYKIPCRDCNMFYIGETGRDLSTRIKEQGQN